MNSSVGRREKKERGGHGVRVRTALSAVSLRRKSSGADYRDRTKALGFTVPRRSLAYRGALRV